MEFPYLPDQVETILDKIPDFDIIQNIWFLRTESGHLFEDFVGYDYVSIGYNYITLDDINNAIKSQSIDIIKDKIEKNEPKSTMPGLIANQLIRFVGEIKKGDLIIIPSNNSFSYYFGYISDNNVFTKNEKRFLDGNLHQKRRNVNWVKEIPKTETSYHFKRICSSQQTLIKVTKHKYIIARTMHSLFKEGGHCHTIININTPFDLDVYAFLTFLHSTLDLTNKFCFVDKGLPVDKYSRIKSKFEISSPGWIDLFSNSGFLIVSLTGILLLILTKSEAEIKYKDLSIKFKNAGLLDTISAFLTARTDDSIKKNIQAIRQFDEDHALELKDLNKKEKHLLDSGSERKKV